MFKGLSQSSSGAETIVGNRLRELELTDPVGMRAWSRDCKEKRRGKMDGAARFWRLLGLSGSAAGRRTLTLPYTPAKPFNPAEENGLPSEGRYVATLSTLCVPGQLLETESRIRDEDGDEKEDASSGGEKCAESGERGSRRLSTTGESDCKGVQVGCSSTGEADCSGGVGERLVTVESAVEREEESEGNSGSGRGDRQRVSSFTELSGRGGTRSLELKSGHAPGKDGVGERATIEKEKEGQDSFWGKVRK
ncbi:hypothetical protein F5888DRAFT_1630155 [Russula emetica]|nr:hypothetical protein F5888DRAFT_1630155 [Russula emetica]